LEYVCWGVLLREELLVNDRGRVVLLQRRETGTGAQEPVAPGRRLRRDVRRGHEVLGGGEVVALTLVRLADRARGGRDDRFVVGSDETIEHPARLVPALVLPGRRACA